MDNEILLKLYSLYQKELYLYLYSFCGDRYQAIRRLEVKKREVIQMQYFGGMSQKEIAAVLHITPENVRVLAYRAKKELKKDLEELKK